MFIMNLHLYIAIFIIELYFKTFEVMFIKMFYIVNILYLLESYIYYS